MEAHAGQYCPKDMTVNAFEKTPRIGLGCKLVPVQNREYENGLFSRTK